MVALYIPLAMLAKQYFGVTGNFAAYPIANIVTGIFAYAWARGTVRQLFRCGEMAPA